MCHTQKRIPYTQRFEPSDEEQELYDLVTEYLRRETLAALPFSQRQLVTMVMFKLLGSSSFAIAGALDSLYNRLKKKIRLYKKTVEKTEGIKIHGDAVQQFLEGDLDGFGDLQDEWEIEDDDETFTLDDIATVNREAGHLEAMRDLSMEITENEKGRNLLIALKNGFTLARDHGGPRKAVIFTESRRTQNYLKQLLDTNGYEGQCVPFNGTNNSPQSRNIYRDWKERHAGTDRVSGSRQSDTRAAIVDCFRESAQIMIATEAAAEGINLQFCSLVINYNMPWNPQRIEQRIGRCHRYGQKYDVVVVNFLNTKNRAEERVYELLHKKFSLFRGVFGASDDVLGAIGNGVDFEKRILAIFRQCRKKEEIDEAFDQLQEEMSSEITAKLKETRQQLLESVDEEVIEKLRDTKSRSTESLGKYQQWLYRITEHALGEYAFFNETDSSFMLTENPFPGTPISTGRYRIGNNVTDAHIYRINHPLAQRIIQPLEQQELPPAKLTFRYTGSPKISVLIPYIGASGTLTAHYLSIDSFEKEDHIIITAVTDDGTVLEDEACRRLFSLEADETPCDSIHPGTLLRQTFEKKKKQIVDEVNTRNMTFFDEEIEKLDKWAEDLKAALEIELKQLDSDIRSAKTQARKIPVLKEKVNAQRKIKEMEKTRKEKRKKLFTRQDEIEEQKESLISAVEEKMEEKVAEKKMFVIRWEIRKA